MEIIEVFENTLFDFILAVIIGIGIGFLGFLVIKLLKR